MLKFIRPIALTSILLSTLFGGELQAQGTRTVRAGETNVLVSGTQPIVITAPPARGTVAVTESTSTPKTYASLYTAPATSTVFTETMTYTNPNPATFTVTVTPAGNDQNLQRSLQGALHALRRCATGGIGACDPVQLGGRSSCISTAAASRR